MYNPNFTVWDIRGVMLEMSKNRQLEYVGIYDAYRIPPFSKKMKIIPMKKY